eukprot:Pgem_evm1s214
MAANFLSKLKVDFIKCHMEHGDIEKLALCCLKYNVDIDYINNNGVLDIAFIHKLCFSANLAGYDYMVRTFNVNENDYTGNLVNTVRYSGYDCSVLYMVTNRLINRNGNEMLGYNEVSARNFFGMNSDQFVIQFFKYR